MSPLLLIHYVRRSRSQAFGVASLSGAYCVASIRRASALSATGGVSKHKATAPDAASDDDEEEEGGEGGTSTLREWLYKNFLHPYPVRAPPSVSQFSLHT